MKNLDIKIIDCHQDLPFSIENNFSNKTIGLRSEYSKNIAGIFSAIFPYKIGGNPFDPKNRKIKSSIEELIRYGNLLDEFIEKEEGRSYLGSNPDNNSIFCIKHLEGGDHIKSLTDIDSLLKNGYKSIGLTRNFDNAISGSNGSNSGLSQLGKKIITKMNNHNMIIDTAHMSDKGMIETAQLSKNPIINSHAGIKEIFNHPRNVNNKFLKALQENGGTIGISPFNGFLKESNANNEDYLRHIEYVLNKIGSDHISFGSDFHGIDIKNSVIGSIDQLNQFKENIIGYFGKDIAKKFFSENIMRVINFHQNQ